MTRRLILLTAVGLLIALAACGDGEEEGASTTAAALRATEAVPFHPISSDAVGVTGTATCNFSDRGVDPEGGGSGLLVVCELDMSDPRVSGNEIIDRFRHFADEDPEGAAAVWVAEDTITNAEGVWRGIAQAADDTTPCGEAHFVGEDDYEGLEFRYYFCHTGDVAELRGWISGAG